jgi:hypothetical protein
MGGVGGRLWGANHFRNVRAERKSDPEWELIPITAIVLEQAFSDVACSDSNDRIFASVVSRGTPKKFDPNDALLERFKMPGDALINDVLEKLPAAVTPLEGCSFDDVVYVALEEGQISFCPGNFGEVDAVRSAVPCRGHGSSEEEILASGPQALLPR